MCKKLTPKFVQLLCKNECRKILRLLGLYHQDDRNSQDNETNLFTYSPSHLFTSKNKKAAFTLAEVLITLGIIGVVAALTLPSVIQNAQRRELQTGLKKGYSTIAQALDMYYYDNGERLTNADVRQLRPILMKYIKDIKDCKNSNCVPTDSNIYKNYTGTTNLYMSMFDDGQFVLPDGSFILIDNGGGSNYLFISIDVNGYKKGPNRLGQDLFMFQILNSNGKLTPMGTPETYYYRLWCDKTGGGDMNGASCTYKALTEKDYFKNLP
jgi:prepilin-type N-terminal cleavage/methylation domain-containing protein